MAETDRPLETLPASDQYLTGPIPLETHVKPASAPRALIGGFGQWRAEKQTVVKGRNAQ